jgi:hypothetical protein
MKNKKYECLIEAKDQNWNIIQLDIIQCTQIGLKNTMAYKSAMDLLENKKNIISINFSWSEIETIIGDFTKKG